MGGSSAPPGDIFRKFNRKTKRELVGERNETMALLKTELRVCEHCIATWQVNPEGRRRDLDQAVNRIARHLQREDSYDLRQRWEAVLLTPAKRLALQARLLGGQHSHTQKVLRQTFEGYRMIYHEHRLWRRETLHGDADEPTQEGRPLLRKSTSHSTIHQKRAVEPKHFTHLDRSGLHAFYDSLILSRSFGQMTENTVRALVYAGEAVGLFLPPPSQKTYARQLYLFYGFVVPRSLLEEWRILTSPQLIQARRHLSLAWHPDTAGRQIDPLIQRHYWNILAWTWRVMKSRKHNLWEIWGGYPSDATFDVEHALDAPREGADLLWREPEARGVQLPERLEGGN